MSVHSMDKYVTHMTYVSHSAIENNVLSFQYMLLSWIFIFITPKFSSYNYTIYKKQTADLF